MVRAVPSHSISPDFTRILAQEYFLMRKLCPDYVDFRPELLADKGMVLSMKGRPLFVTIEKIIFTISFYLLTRDILVTTFR